MLSFMIPTEEKGFNLNAVPQNEVFQVTNGHGAPKPEVTGGSPNNNSHPVPVVPVAPQPAALDNAPQLPLPSAPALPPPAATHDLMEDSLSDATESTLLLRADERADDVLTPISDNTRSSPCGEERPLLPAATVPGKTGKLKRVSFGSSKGSMVETVVYDYEPAQPLREEAGESPVPRPGARHNFVTSTPLSTPAREPSAAERAASKVRVTYFESRKPLPVPEAAEAPEELDVVPEPPAHTQVTATAGEMPTTYIVQTIDSGWENPFRPGGELSKEADQIVRAIQSGRPLDSSLDEADAAAAAAGELGGPDVNGRLEGGAPAAPNGGPAAGEPIVAATVQATTAAAPPPAAARNGGAAPAAPGGGGGGQAVVPQTALAAQQPGTVEVQHTLVKPEDASQVEQVTLKKKPRGKCCVVQ